MGDEGNPRGDVMEAAGAETRSARSDSWTIATGAIVWLVILAVVAFFYFRPDTADVLLDVSAGPPFAAKGSVVYGGVRLTDGQVHLAVSNAKDQRYVSSLVIAVDGKTGEFNGSGPAILPDDARDKPLQVRARFLGRTDKGKVVSGDSIVYLNFAPPLGRLTLWGTLAGTSVLALTLIMLFTGDLTRRKARVLFGMTYFMTFFSLVAPIALTVLVSRNVYLVEMMAAAPIGLVKGTAKGVDTPQWLLNIGGAVTKRAPETTDSTPADATAATGGEDRAARAASPVPDEMLVVGGLAVPFYVVFLAMLGAGINMTIQVPKIQNRYDIAELPEPSTSVFAATLQAPMTMFAASQPQSAGSAAVRSGIRRELIGNYMYLLSAPFLAIAVYYLLQVIATNTAAPVLVLMAFATGLVSDRIISRITRFAQDTLGGDVEDDKDKKGRKDGGEASQPPPPPIGS